MPGSVTCYNICHSHRSYMVLSLHSATHGNLLLRCIWQHSSSEHLWRYLSSLLPNSTTVAQCPLSNWRTAPYKLLLLILILLLLLRLLLLLLTSSSSSSSFIIIIMAQYHHQSLL